MSDEPFRTAPEEIGALTKEIAEARLALREIATRLAQVERHVKRAFRVESRTPQESALDNSAKSPVGRDELLRCFDQLVEDTRNGAGDLALNQLERLSPADLRLLAHELGLPGGKKVSKRALTASIQGRIRESVMLSKNQNVTESRAKQLSKDGS